jgi:hypothetical protein
MIALKESLLSKTKDKVEKASNLTANDIYKEIGFPLEDDYQTLSTGVAYYKWTPPQSFIEEYKEQFKTYSVNNKESIFGKINQDNWSTAISISTEVIPHKLPGSKIGRYVRVALIRLGFFNHLNFITIFVGGSKKSVIKKAYKLLEYLKDEKGLLGDILLSTNQLLSPDTRSKIIEKTQDIIKKYNLDL